MTTTSHKPQLLLAISRDDDGTYTITDALGRAHEAETPNGIGKIVARLVADEDLPKTKFSFKRDKDVGMVAEIAKRVTTRFAPDLENLVEAVEPAAHALVDVARRSRSKRRPSNRRGGVARS